MCLRKPSNLDKKNRKNNNVKILDYQLKGSHLQEFKIKREKMDCYL